MFWSDWWASDTEPPEENGPGGRPKLRAFAGLTDRGLSHLVFGFL
jgi:hypothetical protein